MTGRFHGISDTNPEFPLLSVEHFCLVVLLGLVVDGKNHDDIDIDDIFASVGLRINFYVFMCTHMYVAVYRCVCVCVCRYGSCGNEVRKQI